MVLNVFSKRGEFNLERITRPKKLITKNIVFKKGFGSNDIDKGLTFLRVKSDHFEFLKVAPKLEVVRVDFESRSKKIRKRDIKELLAVFVFK